MVEIPRYVTYSIKNEVLCSCVTLLNAVLPCLLWIDQVSRVMSLMSKIVMSNDL